MARTGVPSESNPQSPARGGRRRYAWKPGAAARPLRDDGIASLRRDDGTAPHLPALAALGLEGLVDTHVHWFPDNVQRKIWAYLDRRYWGICYGGSPPERLEWLRRNGVRAFTTLNYAHRPGMAAWLNEWTAEFAADVPEAIPCGTFYPESGVSAYVQRSIEEYRFRGYSYTCGWGISTPAIPCWGPLLSRWRRRACRS